MQPAAAVNPEELLALLSEITGNPRDSIRGDGLLTELPGWDSLAILEVMVRLDETYGVMLSPDSFESCTRVDELIQSVMHEIGAARQ